MANVASLRGQGLFRSLVIITGIMVGPTGARADFVPVGEKWGLPEFGTGATVTWSLRPTEIGPLGPEDTALEEFMPPGFEAEIQAGFDAWSEVADLTFIQVPDTGPNGSDIRIGGRSIDGPSGTVASAFFPTESNGTSAGDISFDTADLWEILPGASGLELRSDIFQVATHEIAHSIGLRHSVGVPSIVGARNSGYRGLLPADIAGAQFIYGAAPGYVAPPSANTNLTLTGNSQIEVSFTAFDGALVLSDTALLSGDLQAFIGLDGLGVPTDFGFRGGSLEVGDMLFGLIDPLLEIEGSILDSLLTIVSANDAVVGLNGQFDAADTVLGFVDGDFIFDVSVPPLGIDVSGDFEFFTEPLSLPILAGNSIGTILQTPTGVQNEFDVLVQIPLALSTTVDVSFLAPDLPPGLIEITIDFSGIVEATGVVVVPEPATWGTMFMGLCVFAMIAARHGRGSRRKQATYVCTS